MKKTTLLIPLCTLLSAPIFAQKNTVASGSVAIGAGGTVSYSIGQTDFIAATGGGGRITQGVQQPYEIFVVTGIEKKDIPHLFDRFYRADKSRSKNDSDGFGLGLSIAKRIIDTNNGKVEVESEIEKGTIFIVTLPLK